MWSTLCTDLSNNQLQSILIWPTLATLNILAIILCHHQHFFSHLKARMCSPSSYQKCSRCLFPCPRLRCCCLYCCCLYCCCLHCCCLHFTTWCLLVNYVVTTTGNKQMFLLSLWLFLLLLSSLLFSSLSFTWSPGPGHLINGVCCDTGSMHIVTKEISIVTGCHWIDIQQKEQHRILIVSGQSVCARALAKTTRGGVDWNLPTGYSQL